MTIPSPQPHSKLSDLPLAADRVLTDSDALRPYCHDEGVHGTAPLAVVLPETTAEVAAVLRWANDRRVSVVPRGAGSGLSGAAVPLSGAVVLSLERMASRLEIDREGMTARVHPGVITGDLRRAAEAAGLLYAPIPASVDFCTVGGNVATNAGGLCAVKYGVTRQHVLALEAVLPTGDVICTGGSVQKSTTGYDLTQLLCGSEGTLAVITEVTVRLLPLPAARMTMLVPFESAADLTRGVVAVLAGDVIPPTMEFLPRAAIACVRARHAEMPYPFPDAAAALLVEMDGADEASVGDALATLAETLATHGAGEPAVAATPRQRDDLWSLRKQVRDAIANSGDFIEADSVVPRARLPQLHAASMAAAATAGVDVICYGHAGDGNLHTYFRRGDLATAAWQHASRVALEHLFQATVALGGTISGEHGIGSSKREYMRLAFGEAELGLMRRVKAAFDPRGILNPHKVIPDATPSQSEGGSAERFTNS